MNYRNTENGYTKYYNKIAFWVILIVAGVLFHLTVIKWLDEQNKMTVTNPFIPTVAFAGETLESKVDALKDEVLDTLAKCESAGRKEEDGIAILDSNDKGSYGPFQFQRKTVIHYMAQRGTPVNGRDAIILALQGDKARALAKYIIFDTKAGVENDWYNCSNKHNLQVEVDIINKLK